MSKDYQFGDLERGTISVLIGKCTVSTSNFTRLTGADNLKMPVLCCNVEGEN